MIATWRKLWPSLETDNNAIVSDLSGLMMGLMEGPDKINPSQHSCQASVLVINFYEEVHKAGGSGIALSIL